MDGLSAGNALVIMVCRALMAVRCGSSIWAMYSATVVALTGLIMARDCISVQQNIHGRCSRTTGKHKVLRLGCASSAHTSPKPGECGSDGASSLRMTMG